MPELPEVEHVARGLSELIVGKTIAQFDLIFPGLIKNVSGNEFTAAILGAIIESIIRRGKYILILLNNQNVLEVHLRMTGTFLFYLEPVTPGPHTRAVFTFEESSQLHFKDIRKFGTFRLWKEAELGRSPAFSIGLDPLEKGFNLLRFEEKLNQKPKSRLKPFFLDQKNIAGLGNIYVDEVLYQAKLHPARRVESLDSTEIKVLFEAIVSVLQQSIESGGTSFSDYHNLQGVRGAFQEHLKVYQKENYPCFCCGRPLQKITLAGRGTHLCLFCQPFDAEHLSS